MEYKKINYTGQVSKMCKQCGMQISKTARICPYCCTKQGITKETIFKAIGIYMLFCCMIAIFLIIGDDEQNTKTNSNISDPVEVVQQTSKGDASENNKFEYADTTIKYLRSKIDYNFVDEKCLYVYFEIKNNSNENQTFNYLVTCKAFQNGVELDKKYIYDCDEAKNGGKEIQPGASVTVAQIYELGDSTENIMLEVRPYSVWSDRLLFEKEFKITE